MRCTERLKLAVVLMVAAWAQPAAAGQGDVAVSITIDGQHSPELSERLVRAAQDGARGAGWGVARPESPRRCPTEECVKAMAIATGASHILIVRVATSKTSHDVTFRIWRSALQTWAGVERGPDPCLGRCDAARLVDDVRLWSERVLVDEAKQQDTRYVPTPDIVLPNTDAARAPSAEPRSTSASVQQPQSSAVAGQRGPLSLLGAGLLAGGVLIAVSGGVIWFEDGRTRQCEPGGCWVYDTKWLGVAGIVSGAAIAATGGWVMFRGDDRRTLSVSVSVNQLTLQGRF